MDRFLILGFVNYCRMQLMLFWSVGSTYQIVASTMTAAMISDVVSRLFSVKTPDGDSILCVRDIGIGMTAETVRDYFLRAGASFRDSRRWRQEFVDTSGRSRVRRSGRFGVGVFAGFLLGSAMEVVTRWMGASSGLKFSVSIGSDLIELGKVDAPVGTTVTIKLSPEIADKFIDDVWPRCADWYGLANPSIEFRTEGVGSDRPVEQQVAITEFQLQGKVAGWGAFATDGFARVSWTYQRLIAQLSAGDDGQPMRGPSDKFHVFDFSEYNSDKSKDRRNRSRYGYTPDEKSIEEASGAVYCNGFLIGSPDKSDYNLRSRRNVNVSDLPLKSASFAWGESRVIVPPSILIADNEGAFPLTLRRDAILEPLPFERELERDIIVDMIGWFLACAPTAPLWVDGQAAGYARKYPLVRGRNPLGCAFFWICSEEGVGLLHRELLRRLGTKALLLAGRTRSSKSTVSVEGVWGVGDGVTLGRDILAVPLPRQLFVGELSNEQPRDVREEVARLLMEYVQCLKESSEFAMSGGLIIMSGTYGFEEIRIDNCSDATTDLIAAIGKVAKATTYYDFHSGSREMTLELRFAGEVRIKPTEDESPMSNLWDDFVGDELLPFDEIKRAKIVSNACRDARIQASVDKWSEWRLNNEAQLPQLPHPYAQIEV